MVTKSREIPLFPALIPWLCGSCLLSLPALSCLSAPRALPPARPLSPPFSSEAGCPLPWGSPSPSSTQEAVVEALGTWDTERKGGRQVARATWEVWGPCLLPAPPQTNPPPTQAGPLSSGQGQKHLTWGLRRASSSILCHISSLSFIRNRPLREQRQDWGGIEREAQGAGVEEEHPQGERLTSASLPCTVVYSHQTASDSSP